MTFFIFLTGLGLPRDFQVCAEASMQWRLSITSPTGELAMDPRALQMTSRTPGGDITYWWNISDHLLRFIEGAIYCPQFDRNMDGWVDLRDFALIQNGASMR